VPTDAEWTILENYLVLNGYNWDGTTDISEYNKIAKSLAAKSDWWVCKESDGCVEGAIGNDLSSNNRTGFSALPGGGRYSNGSFDVDDQSDGGNSWSATEYDAYSAYGRIFYYRDVSLKRDYGRDKGCGLPARLLRD
jgi:uncharacterized protein (TIGR02145 family)